MMAATEQPSTRADFAGSGWQQLIAECHQKDCYSYSAAFCKRLSEMGEAGDPALRGVFTVLYVVTSVSLREDDEEPFGPRFVGRAARGTVPDDLTPDQYRLLEEIAADIADAEMRARVCDLVWVMRRKHHLAKLGVSAYLETARTWEDWDNWVRCAERLTRAVRLAKSLGRGGTDEFDQAIAQVEDLLTRMDGEDPLFLSARMMELLQEFRRGEPLKYAVLAEKAARRAEAEGGHAFERAGRYWHVASDWYTLAGDAGRREAARIAEAESLVKHAAEAAARPRENIPHITAASLLERAYHALRKLGTPAAGKRADEVYLLLVEQQRLSTSELLSFNHKVDLSDPARMAEEAVSGKSLEQALAQLALLVRPMSVTSLREQAVEMLSGDPLMAMFSTATVSSSGKIVATRPHFDSSPEGAERATVAEMHRNAVLHQRIAVNAAVMPGVLAIRHEHPVREQDFFRLASNSYFVPPGREQTFAKGLYAGYCRDLSTATHLLVPQIENAIRVHLEARGAITSGFDRHSRQNEFDLNTTLYMDELAQVFDEDTIFCLRNILVEHHGTNLRNMMAHGLLDDRELQSEVALFLWALTLRLCLTVRHPQDPEGCSPADEPSTVAGPAAPE